MTIVRRKQYTDNFTIIDRRALEDTRLSWAARGLLAYLLSKPDHWEVSIAHLMTQGNLRRDGIRNLLGELIKFGYATRETKRSGDGLVRGYDYTITDLPPATDLPAPVQPAPVSPLQVSTDTTVSTEKPIGQNAFDPAFDQFWKTCPKKVKKKPSRTAFERAYKSWRKATGGETTPALFAAMLVEDMQRRMANDRQWVEGFVPDPTTYLNQERYNDDIQPLKSGPVKKFRMPADDAGLLKLCAEYKVHTTGKSRYDLENELRSKM